jgi:hypothetical protein
MDVQPPDGSNPSSPPMPPPPSNDPGSMQPGYGLGIGPRRPPGWTGRQTRPLPGLLVLAGGLATVIGVFMPWVQASRPGASISENGIRIGTFGTLFLGGLAAARGASMLRPDRLGMRLGSPVVGGVLIAGLIALRWSLINQAVTDYRAQPGVTANIGLGVWLVIAGAACIVLGGLMSGRPARL